MGTGLMPDLRDGLAAAPNEHVGASRSDIAVQDQVRGLLPKAHSYLHHLSLPQTQIG